MLPGAACCDCVIGDAVINLVADQADFMITNFSRNEALEEAITVSVSAKVTYSTSAPTWLD